MNDQMNAPMSPMPSGPTSFFRVWMNAVTKPSEQTFANMASEPSASARKAFLWVFVSSLVYFFPALLVQGAVMRRFLEQFGGGGNFGVGDIEARLISLICGAPIAAIITVVSFAIGTAIIQWVAKLFGGKGTFGQLAYVFAAILAPFYLINIVFTLLSAIPFVGLCFGILSLAVGLYALVLNIMAVKGVNQFGWGQAAGSLFLPGLVLACCLIAPIAIMRALGPAVGNTFSSINNSLP